MGYTLVQGPRGPEALWNGLRLSSAYHPDREAEAWAQGRPHPAGSLVFVAGDPWGLACRALDARGCRAVPLLPGLSGRSLGIAAGGWAPEEGPLETFLNQVLEREGPEAVVWDVWPAFERVAPDLVLDWSRRFRDTFRTFQGSWLTQRHFGRRFWTNSLRNLVGWDQPAAWTPGKRPIVVAASGPSLDEGLDLLAQDRDRFDLWALPSSFETLVQRGLRPDAAVATDGGFYAREHLHRLAGTDIPVLAALSSAADPVLEARPCAFFGQGMAVEKDLLASVGVRAEVPSQGTVAVTALRLALGATKGPVLVAGLDLSFKDLRSHTSPHTTDRRLAPTLGRLAPGEQAWAHRVWSQAPLVFEGVRTTPALLTYARWFQSSARFPRTVHRIAPSPLRWSTMDDVTWEGARALWRAGPRSAVGVRWTRPSAWPDRGARVAGARRALEALADRIRGAQGDEPWLIDAAKTAVPGALAQAWREARQGLVSPDLPRALAAFVEDLAGDLA